MFSARIRDFVSIAFEKSRSVYVNIPRRLFGAAIVAACFNSYVAMADDFATAIDNTKTAIAPVFCLTPGGDPSQPKIDYEGSVFFLDGHGSFLTAAHVIKAFLPPQRFSGCQIPAVYVPREGQWHTPPQDMRWHKFAPSDCMLNEDYDLARCKTVEDLANDVKESFHPMLFVIDDDIKHDGTPVAFSGFPLSNQIPLTAIGNIAGYLPDDKSVDCNN
jgi:hypothetical protein